MADNFDYEAEDEARRLEEERAEEERRQEEAQRAKEARRNELEAEKAGKQREADEKRAQIKKINEKIERLQQAKSHLCSSKNTFCTVKQEVNNIIHDNYTWTGDKYTEFKEDGNTVLSQYSQYNNEIQQAIDSIEEEISRLLLLRTKEEDIWNRLWTYIQYLANEIKSLW